MPSTQKEIELTYALAIIVLLLFATFITVFVMLYKKRQTAVLIEKKYMTAELENERLTKEIDTLKAIQKERERISLDLHDDLGSGLSAMRLDLEFLRSHGDSDVDDSGLDDIIGRSKQLTETMREIVWSLNLQYDTLESFLDFVRDYTHRYFTSSEIDVVSNFPKVIPVMEMDGLKRRNALLIVKELLHNVLKHSQTKTLVITITCNSGTLELEVQDHGVGFNADQIPGNGLQGVQKRVDSAGGELAVYSSDKGTKVYVTMPLQP